MEVNAFDNKTSNSTETAYDSSEMIQKTFFCYGKFLTVEKVFFLSNN